MQTYKSIVNTLFGQEQVTSLKSLTDIQKTIPKVNEHSNTLVNMLSCYRLVDIEAEAAETSMSILDCLAVEDPTDLLEATADQAFAMIAQLYLILGISAEPGMKFLPRVSKTDTVQLSYFNGAPLYLYYVLNTQAGTEEAPLGSGNLIYGITPDGTLPELNNGSITWKVDGITSATVPDYTDVIVSYADGTKENIKLSLTQYSDAISDGIMDNEVVRTVIEAIPLAGSVSADSLKSRLAEYGESPMITRIREKLEPMKELTAQSGLISVLDAIRHGSDVSLNEAEDGFKFNDTPGFTTSIIMTVVAAIGSIVALIVSVLFKAVAAVVTLIFTILSTVFSFIQEHITQTSSAVKLDSLLPVWNLPGGITPETSLSNFGYQLDDAKRDMLTYTLSSFGCAAITVRELLPFYSLIIPTSENMLSFKGQAMLRPDPPVSGDPAEFTYEEVAGTGKMTMSYTKNGTYRWDRNTPSSYLTYTDAQLRGYLGWNIAACAMNTNIANPGISVPIDDCKRYDSIINNTILYADANWPTGYLDQVNVARKCATMLAGMYRYGMLNFDGPSDASYESLYKLMTHKWFQVWTSDLQVGRIIGKYASSGGANSTDLLPGQPLLNPNVEFPSLSRSSLITSLVTVSITAAVAAGATLVIKKKRKQRATARYIRRQAQYDQAVADYTADPSNKEKLDTVTKANKKLNGAMNKCGKLGIQRVNGKSTGASATSPSGVASATNTLDELNNLQNAATNLSVSTAENAAKLAQGASDNAAQQVAENSTIVQAQADSIESIKQLLAQ